MGAGSGSRPFQEGIISQVDPQPEKGRANSDRLTGDPDSVECSRRHVRLGFDGPEVVSSVREAVWNEAQASLLHRRHRGRDRDDEA